MKYKEDSNRLKAVLSHLDLKSSGLSKELGYKSNSSIYEVEFGNRPLSNKLAAKISLRYSQISKLYLIGESDTLLLNKGEQRNQKNILIQKRVEKSQTFKEQFDALTLEVVGLRQSVADLTDLNKKLLQRQEDSMSASYEQYVKLSKQIKG